MKEFCKKYYKLAIAAIIAIGVGVIAEFIYAMPLEKQADFQYLQADQIETQDFEFVEDKYVSTEGDGNIHLSFPKQYIDKIYYRYNYPETVYRDQNDNHGQRSAVINVRKSIDSYTISMPEKVGGIVVTGIAIDNTGNYSTERILFYSLAAVFVMLLIAILKGEVKWKPERIFLIVAASVGSLIVLALPVHKVGMDEETHFGKAFYLFDTLTGQETITFPPHMSELLAMSTEDWPYGIAQSEEENKLEKEYWNEHLKYNLKETKDEYQEGGYQLRMSTFGYFPQVLMIQAGTLLRLDFSTIFMLGRLGNLIMYCLVIFLAIRHIPVGKRIMLVLALMPTTMFSAVTYTCDSTVTAFSFLGIAYLIEELTAKDRPISYKNCAIFVGAFIFASFPKPVYIPMILLALFFPASKFRSRKEKYIFKGIVATAFLTMTSTFVVEPVLNPALAGDPRGGDTNAGEQLRYIFEYPWRYTKLLLSSIGKTFMSYCFGSQGLGRMGHLRFFDFSIPIGITCIYTALTDGVGQYGAKIRRSHKIIIATIAFAMMCLIWTALYVGFTPLRNEVIRGVQGRYYLPVTMFLCLALGSKKLCGILKERLDCALITAASITILMVSVYGSIIVNTF